MPPKTVKNIDVGLRRPDQPRVGRHLDSVFMHYKHCIISVLSFTPTCSKKKSMPIRYLHVCMHLTHGMRTCKTGPIWPMILAKPAESLHERMHTSTNTYNLLIRIDTSTRNMKINICASREACAGQPCGGPDMLARACMHA